MLPAGCGGAVVISIACQAGNPGSILSHYIMLLLLRYSHLILA